MKRSKKEKSVLSNHLQFSVLPTKTEYADIMFLFEILFREVMFDEVPRENFTIIKTSDKILRLFPILN